MLTEFSSLMKTEQEDPDDWMKITPEKVVIYRSNSDILADPNTTEQPSDPVRKKAIELFQEQNDSLGKTLTLTSIRVWSSYVELTIKEETDIPIDEFLQWYFSKLYGNSIQLRTFSVAESRKSGKFRSKVSFKSEDTVNFEKYDHNFVTGFSNTETTLSVALPLTLKNTLRKRPQNIKDKLSSSHLPTETQVLKFVYKSGNDSFPKPRLEIEISKIEDEQDL